MSTSMDERHRKEVKDAYGAVARLRVAASISALIGLVAVVWIIVLIATGNSGIDEGIVLLAGAALATVVPAAGLYAASFRTSLAAARLERQLGST